jgi:hypothetical protein
MRGGMCGGSFPLSSLPSSTSTVCACPPSLAQPTGTYAFADWSTSSEWSCLFDLADGYR